MKCARWNRRASGFAILLAIAAFANAGCLGDPAGPTGHLVPAQDGTREIRSHAVPSDFAGASPLTPLEEVDRTFNGAFGVQDACATELCRDPAHIQLHDLSDAVPFGLRTRVEAHIVTDPPEAGIHMDVVAPGKRSTAGRTNLADPPERIDQGLTRLVPGPVALLLTYQRAALAEDVTYRVEVRITAERTLLPGSPVALELGPSSTFQVARSREDAAARISQGFTLYRPDDTVYGTYAFAGSGADIRMPADAIPGRYVLVPLPGVGLRIHAEHAATMPTERILATSEKVATPAGASLAADGQFTTDRPVLYYRMMFAKEEPVTRPAGPPDDGRFTARIVGSAGTVLDGDATVGILCHFCLWGQSIADVWTSDPGVPHPLGDHGWVLESEAGTGGTVTIDTLTWAR